MKRILSLLLILCLSAGVLPALGEEAKEAGDPEAVCYDFRLSARLNPDAFSASRQKALQGYVDLLDAVSLEGSFALALDGSVFDLSLSVIPTDAGAAPLRFRARGNDSCFFITSPLLGQEQVALSADSLLDFCVKGYNHLGVPFQYAAYLYPYVWKVAFREPVNSWNRMVRHMKSDGKIKKSRVKKMTQRWAAQLDANHFLNAIIAALEMDAGTDVYGFLSEIPDWFLEDVTQNHSIRVRKENGAEYWHAAWGDIAVRVNDPDHQSLKVTLPETPSGWTPFWNCDRTVDRDFSSLSLHAGIGRQDGQDMLDLLLDADSLPAVWPADCESTLRFSLSGDIFPETAFSLSLEGKSNGDFVVRVSPYTEGPAWITLTGSVVPRAEHVRIPAADPEEVNVSTDILRVNDETLAAFVSKIIRPAVAGMVDFLIGVPTSACQSILDDLTDSGILGMLLTAE